MRESHYQVVVLGAGVAGLSAALALAQQGIKVAVFDKQTAQKQSFGECVHGTIQPILAELKLFDSFIKDAHFELQGYQIDWDELGHHERSLITSPYGTGWILNREKFDTSLISAAIEAGVDIFWQSRLTEFSEQSDGWQLHFMQPDTSQYVVESNFIVDATGRARTLTRKLNIAEKKGDSLVACCAHLNHSGSGAIARQEAVIHSSLNGWWYLAPFSNSKATLCYFTDNDLDMPKTFSELVELAYEHASLAPYLDSCDLNDNAQMKITPAYSSCIAKSVGNNWLAVGDASCSYDPLSSYGITSALGSAFYASKAITRWFIGQPQYLKEYEALMQDSFLSYLPMKNEEYEKVTQFNSPFWRRRNLNQPLHHLTKE